MRFSVRFSSGTPARVFRDCAVAAEELGFDQVWTGNDLVRRSGIVPVTVALAATSRIRVGSGVLNPVSLHPAEIAMIAAGLQDFSGARRSTWARWAPRCWPWPGARPTVSSHSACRPPRSTGSPTTSTPGRGSTSPVACGLGRHVLPALRAL